MHVEIMMDSMVVQTSRDVVTVKAVRSMGSASPLISSSTVDTFIRIEQNYKIIELKFVIVFYMMNFYN